MIVRTIALSFAIVIAVGFAGCIRRPRDAGPDGSIPRGAPASPIAVVRAYAEAWRDGDSRTFLSLVHARTPRHRRVVEAFADVIATTPKLRRAAEQKFGADDAEAIVGHLIPPTDTSGRQMLEYLDDSDTEIEMNVEGKRATIGLEPVGEVELIRVAGRWMIAIEDPGDDHQQVQSFRHIAEAQRQLSRDIEVGKYKSADQAVRALLDYHPEKEPNGDRGQST